LVLWLDGNNTNTQVITPTISNDISGNNNNGTLINGVTLVRDGQRSFSFDGTNDYQIIYGSTPSFSAGVSIDMVLKPTAKLSNYTDILLMLCSQGTQFVYINDTTMAGYLEINNSIQGFGNLAVTANQFTRFTITYDNSNIKKYKNGVSVTFSPFQFCPTQMNPVSISLTRFDSPNVACLFSIQVNLSIKFW